MDKEDISFSFHKEVLVEGYLDVAQEEEVISNLTGELITKLNTYLNDHFEDIQSIKLVIHPDGKISGVIIDGKKLSGRFKDDLTQLIIHTKINNPTEGLLNITILF